MSRKTESQRQKQLKELRCALAKAEGISIDNLAVKIREIGFQCLRCGDCCTGDENSVVVFPFEIRRIMDAAGEPWHDVVEPPSTGEWDRSGNFHTLEWRIGKCENSCRFYSNGLCEIYESRPILCSTYPFYLADGDLKFSECRGLGREIGPKDACEIAALLKERSIVEIREAISLIESFRDFQRGEGVPGKGACVVHDSEGEHKMDWGLFPALRNGLKI